MCVHPKEGRGGGCSATEPYPTPPGGGTVKDDPKGFWAVYRGAFDLIFAEVRPSTPPHTPGTDCLICGDQARGGLVRTRISPTPTGCCLGEGVGGGSGRDPDHLPPGPSGEHPVRGVQWNH